MENKQYRDSLIERRHQVGQKGEWWERLTLAQKFSASSLAKYGYELSFIRISSSGSLAVMQQDENISTVAEDGDIDTNPDIHIR